MAGAGSAGFVAVAVDGSVFVGAGAEVVEDSVGCC